jgi:hypothetical protein
LLQIFTGGVGVGVSKLLLNDRQRDAVHYQLGGQGMAKSMRVDSLLDAERCRRAWAKGRQAQRVYSRPRGGEPAAERMARWRQRSPRRIGGATRTS